MAVMAYFATSSSSWIFFTAGGGSSMPASFFNSAMYSSVALARSAFAAFRSDLTAAVRFTSNPLPTPKCCLVRSVRSA